MLVWYNKIRIEMKINMKLGYALTLLISIGIFNSCSGIFVNHTNNNQNHKIVQKVSYPIADTAYGTYLAARLAHIRQDYSLAADYYIKSINLGAKNPELYSRVYLLLSSEGRIEEAAKYAKKALENKDQNNFLHFVIMANSANIGDYEQAHQSIQSINDKTYKSAIAPLFEAWIYAAENNKDEALKQLETLKQEKSLHSFYYMHRGMINDYFNDKESAQADFDTIIEDKNLELSFRSLQIISNFYTRNSQQEKAKSLIEKYYNKNKKAKMLGELLKLTQKVDKERTLPIIDTPQKGLGEAIFNIGTVFRNYQNDIAHIFTALSLYLNPQNEAAVLSSANLLEMNNRKNEAIKQYQKINKDSSLYFTASLKIATIYMEKKENKKALKQLEMLSNLYPDDYNVLFNLGELNRVNGNHIEAIKYYNKALKHLPESLKNDWTIYYALGISYEKSNQWEKAEDVLKQALKTSNRHPYILNYLGYMWLENNQNYNEALYMIFEAYQQNPESGHIMDSLGWALYRMGKYNDAIGVLEKAAEYLPSNAIVCDHLGDVYWQVGRENEARFQWKHALTLKEDADSLDKELINEKIKNGAKRPTAILFNEALLIERLKALDISN